MYVYMCVYTINMCVYIYVIIRGFSKLYIFSFHKPEPTGFY